MRASSSTNWSLLVIFRKSLSANGCRKSFMMTAGMRARVGQRPYPIHWLRGMELFLQQLTDLIQTEPTLAKWVVVPSQPHGVFLQVLAESHRRMRGRRQLG